MRAPIAMLAAVALGGCAPLGPAGGSRASGPSPGAPPAPRGGKLAVAQATHEYPTPAPRERAAGGGSDAPAAVRAFAQAYVNWSAASVSADMQALARQSVGQARAAMQLAAAQTAQDYELQRGGVSNQGTVEAVAPLARGHDQYVVVTLERTTATATNAYAGLRPAWHVALATVTQTAPGRWVVSGWQPEN